MNESSESKVRYSEQYRRAAGRQQRRSVLLGILFGLLASLLLVADGVRAWMRHGMVDMGARFSFAKYPPSLVIGMGVVGLLLCGYCLWAVVSDRPES